MARGRKPTKRLYPPKPKGPKNPKRAATMLANRVVTVMLRCRHMINGVNYGPGEVKIPSSLATQLLHTEGHAVAVEEQFRGTKAAIIGGRKGTAHAVVPVPVETFDTEWTKENPILADRVRGSQYSDPGSGNPI